MLPAVFFIKAMEDELVDRRIEADRAGTRYFRSEPMRRTGAAGVQRDLATLMRIGPAVDVNTPGDDMSLIRRAVRSPGTSRSDRSELPALRALLALGAKPDDAMSAACVRLDPALLQMLLQAGGVPNLLVSPRQPLVFDQMSNITPRNFRLLADMGST